MKFGLAAQQAFNTRLGRSCPPWVKAREAEIRIAPKGSLRHDPRALADGDPQNVSMSMTPGGGSGRWPLIDAARGVAIIAMIVYHAVWDLGYFGFTSIDAERDPFWRWFAHLTAGSFLALVGIGLVLATLNGFRLSRYLRRLAIIVGAALLVTAGTYWVLPEAYVTFGILHCIAAASVLALPFLRLPVWVSIVGAVISFAAPTFLANPFFDAPGWHWLGLSTIVPPSVDYVPILPWFGATLTGVAAARLALAWRDTSFWSRWQPKAFAGNALVKAGRWSLLIYLLHQPVLFGAMYAISLVATPAASARTVEDYTRACESACQLDGHDAVSCSVQCKCDVESMERAGILDYFLAGRLPDADADRLPDIIGKCRP